MGTQPPEENQGAKDSRNEERFHSVEERLGHLEEDARLRTVEERVQDLEEGRVSEIEGENEGVPDIEGEGQRTLYLTLAALLKDLLVVQTIAALPKTVSEAVKDRSDLRTKEIEAQRRVSARVFYFGLGFSAFVLVALSALAWHDKITKDVFAGLVGSLIGYWYGREKGR